MNFEVLTWQSFQRVPHSYIAAPWRSWVLDPGSLTQSLVKASGGDFFVNVTHQGWGLPTPDERRILKLSSRQHALIREVELVCQQQPWVRARSIIPVQTLKGSERRLKHLGDKPLGALLFASRVMQRKDIELTRLTLPGQQLAFARRSVFLLNHKPLLVSEYFLPELIRSTEGVQTIDSQAHGGDKSLLNATA